jgi:hypothetical protein
MNMNPSIRGAWLYSCVRLETHQILTVDFDGPIQSH